MLFPWAINIEITKSQPIFQGEKIVCIIDISGKANVVDDNGNPKSCLTTRYSNFGPISMKYEGQPVKKATPIVKKCIGGESIHLWIDAGNNDLFGNFQNNGIRSGKHSINWNPDGLSCGVYFYRLSVKSGPKIGKSIYVK